VKTAERAHTPKTLWEKTTLSRNYAEALEKLDSELEYWPKFLMHKCKQRLTKIHQVLIRMRKLRKEGGPLLEPISQKDERRERVREDKALRAAKLEKSIESELLERLKQGTYGEIYNYPSSAYEKALKEADAQYEDELLESDDGEEDVEQRTEFFEGDLSEDDEADGEDVEDYWKEPPASKPAAKKRPAAAPPAAASTKKPKRPPGPYVEIEYETEPEKGMTVQNW
jgi:protein MAK16